MPLNDIWAAIRWWAVITAIGTAAAPLTLFLFHRLPDRGYAFTKMAGLLIASYFFWLSGSLGFTGNDAGGMMLALALLVALSVWAYRHASSEAPLKQWAQANKAQIAITELLFVTIFGLWVWVRAQNPAIAATEKPMEFAFLNAIGRSSNFPPLDPWLSGFAISYYYFGYVMTSMIGRLALVAEPVAFNLAIAWLVAGTAVGAFGMVYNLAATRNGRRAAVTLGVIAAIALPIAGNLEVGLELLHGNGIGSDQFWEWLDVRDLNQPAAVTDTPRYQSSGWWWWRSSRVIHEYHLSGRPEEGLEPIAEFPGFSFILGDLHPHVLALPFAFLSLAVAYAWWLQGKDACLDGEEWDKSGWRDRAQLLLQSTGRPLWGFTILVLGGLSFLNTWDVLIHLFVVLGAFVLAAWRRDGRQLQQLPAQTGLAGVMLVATAILLYLPFYLGFRSQAGAPFLLPMLMRPTRLAHFAIIFGMPLLSITLMVVALSVRARFRHWKAGLLTAVSLLVGLLLLMLLLSWGIAASAEGAGRVIELAAELNISLPPRPDAFIAPGWGAGAILALLPAVFGARMAYSGMILFLLALLALVVSLWIDPVPRQTPPDNREADALPFVLLLVGTGILLTLGPEFVYLRDNFGFRLNTIFKFYYQAWVMFGVAALFALGYLWQEIRIGLGRVWPLLATTGYGLALAVALLFPYFGIQSRTAEYRGAKTAETREPATLDGLAQFARAHPDEYAAIQWLRDEVPGTPTILEAVGGQYTGFGRVSASTGLPTLLGWAGHEYQWRGSNTLEPGVRDPAVRDIYSEPDWEHTVTLLDRYQVEYIYVGGLELNTYGPQAKEKFAGRLEVVYQNAGVTIYRWQPE
ncbi:MAG: DUF2298 domain-containing protein [Anaerolineae bacterium]